MSRNRYVGDYRLVESIDGRGRIRTDYEYIGANYAYAGGAKDVRRWLKRQVRPRYAWHGESLKAATAAFEAAILSQALAAHGGNVAAAARALGSTPRIVAYKARKYNLKPKTSKTKENDNGNL